MTHPIYPPPPTVTEALRVIPLKIPDSILAMGLSMLRAVERAHLEGYRVELPRDPALTCAEHRESEMIASLLFRYRWGWGPDWPAHGTCWCVGCCKRGHN